MLVVLVVLVPLSAYLAVRLGSVAYYRSKREHLQQLRRNGVTDGEGR